MKKLGTFCLFLGLAIVSAGAFGVIHDQISYTVSHEYFTRFKFLQFHLVDSPLPERLRVAEIGFLASWWMGIPIGLLTGVAGFIHPDARQMRSALLRSILAIVGFTLAFALCGLFYGYLQTRTLDLAHYRHWFIPKDVQNLRAFLCAGYMHNSAYLGGILAIPIAWVFHFIYRNRQARGAEARRSPEWG